MSTPATTFAATAAPAPDHLELPVPVVHVVQSLQVQFFDTVVETPVSLTVQGTQTSTSLGPAPVRPMKLAETMKEVEIEPPLSAVSIPPLRVATPVVDAPNVMVEHVLPAASVAPAPAPTCATPALVDDCVAPVLAVFYAAPAPVVEHVAPALVETDAAVAWM